MSDDQADLGNRNNTLVSWLLVLLAVVHILVGFGFSYTAFQVFNQFNSEYLFLYNSSWAVYTALVLVPASGCYGLACAAFKRRFVKIPRIEDKMSWNSFWMVWNLVLGIGVLAIAIYLTDMFNGVLVIGGATLLGWDVMGLVLPVLYGMAAILIGTSLRWIQKWIRAKRARRARKTPGKKPVIRVSRGMVGLGGTFLFFFAVVGLTVAGMALFPPEWAPGLEGRMPLFSSEDRYTGMNGGPIENFRIPAMLWLPNDTLLAFCEGREDVLSDWGNIDIVMKRSTDGGQTWSSLRIVAENPQGRLTAGNMVPVYDAVNDTVHVLYNWDNERLFHINSTDRGLTWSSPTELTSILGLDGSWHGCGPGVGIQKKYASNVNRLIIPAYGGGIGGSHVIFSDDGGITWNISAGVGAGDEDQVFEAMNGSLCLNMREGQYRLVAWSDDGGETWEDWYEDKALLDVPCMAGVYRMTDSITYEKSRMLYCGTNYHLRAHYTIRMSYDEGITWPVEKEIYPGPSAYGQMVTMSDNETMALLLEAGTLDYRGTIHFLKFDLAWLTGGTDTLNKL